MKRIFTFAAMLLMSVCTFAQSSTPLKGDVNGDGKVDVADIVAVIEIMKNGGGTAGETRYYWYCGQDYPSTNNTIVTNDVLDDYASVSPGWRFTGTTLDADYYFSTTDNNIKDNPTRRARWYMALPVDTKYHLYDDIGEICDEDYATNETVVFNNVTYKIFYFQVESRAMGGITIKK